VRIAGVAEAAMIAIGTIAQSTSASTPATLPRPTTLASPARRRKVATEWIMTANTTAAPAAHSHRVVEW
jgi:hypothetical protein